MYIDTILREIQGNEVPSMVYISPNYVYGCTKQIDVSEDDDRGYLQANCIRKHDPEANVWARE